MKSRQYSWATSVLVVLLVVGVQSIQVCLDATYIANQVTAFKNGQASIITATCMSNANNQYAATGRFAFAGLTAGSTVPYSYSTCTAAKNAAADYFNTYALIMPMFSPYKCTTICGSAIPGCLSIWNGYGYCNCAGCSTDYYLSNGNCFCNSRPNCMNQAASCACVQCQGGFYVAGASGNCVGCSNANCASYSGLGNCVCSACNNGFQLSNQQCQACNQANCVSYTNGCNCGACSPGFRAVAGACTACGNANCASYSSGCTCSACNSGFRLENGMCVACGNSHCSSYGVGQCNCATCDTGHQLLCGACSACSNSNCAAFTPGGACACAQCLTGFALNSLTGYCSACAVSNCVAYAPSGCACTECSSGFRLHGGVCEACDTDPHCVAYSTDTGACHCLGCGAGRILVAQACQEYGPCSACPDGFQFQSGGICSECTVANCVAYGPGDCACAACASGFLLSGAGNNCTAM